MPIVTFANLASANKQENKYITITANIEYDDHVSFLTHLVNLLRYILLLQIQIYEINYFFYKELNRMDIHHLYNMQYFAYISFITYVANVSGIFFD